MEITPLSIPGAFIIKYQSIGDNCGHHSTGFCERTFAQYGIDFTVRQANISHSHCRGTVRGFHFQYPPNAEQKLIRCINGSLFDVIVDLRPESPTFLQSISVELTAELCQALLVPERCAHGFQTLREDTTALYYVSSFYAPGSESGLRWNDPRLGISWPQQVSCISRKDATWPLIAENLDKVMAEMSPAFALAS